jgi:hypothetical protein
MMRVVVFNKDGDPERKTENSLLKDMPDDWGRYVGSEFAASLAQCSGDCIAYIGHVERNDRPELETQAIQIIGALEMAGGGVFIRCSSEGRREPHRKVGLVYVLELRRSFEEMLKRDWTRMIQALETARNEDKLTGFIAGGEASALRDYFANIGASPTLLALSILCQGYLANHTAPNGVPDVETGGAKAVAEALREMGWFEALKDPGVAELIPVDPAVRGERRAFVCRREYWQAVVGAADSLCPTVDETRAQLRLDWGRRSMAGLGSVLKLVDEIWSEGPVGAATVADAYLALVDRLGERRGA